MEFGRQPPTKLSIYKSNRFFSRLVAFEKGKAPVNDQSLRLILIELEKLSLAVQEN